ncbi:MAG TPA: prenyltransferase [Spirochaetota bacterium]|nr:prenyltransferase [Spirochaetota bacterium]HOM38037.1 prenyltransferase [Spirochaetota bacterium]HPQ48841.1 prenyltransferase [Spirochaetota bacterium]
MITILKALRLPFVIISGISTVIIWYYLNLDFDNTFITVLTGILTAHLSGNLWNDFFDFKADTLNLSPTPFSGGSRVLQEKKLSKTTFLLICIIFSTIATGIAIFLLIKFFSFNILLIVLIGSLLTLFYTSAPFRLSYNYLGEITIFLLFGPFIYLGIKQLFRLSFDYKIFFISLILGILTTKILLVNQMPDYKYDIEAGKRTITTALKEKLFYLLIILDIIIFFIAYTIGLKTVSIILCIFLITCDRIIKTLWKKEKFPTASFITILMFIMINFLFFIIKFYNI